MLEHGALLCSLPAFCVSGFYKIEGIQTLNNSKVGSLNGNKGILVSTGSRIPIPAVEPA